MRIAGATLKILFIPPSRIGDAILTTGILRHLLGTYPQAELTVVASPLTASLFGALPRLERVIAMQKRRCGLHWLQLWPQIRQQAWGLVIDMRGSALSYTLRAERRLVHSSRPAGSAPLHKVVETARLIGLEQQPPAPFVVCDAASEATAALLIGDRTDILALAPGASWIGKLWPAARFATLATALLGPNGPMPEGRVLLVGGLDDQTLAEPIRRALPAGRIIDGLGLDLLKTFACLKRTRLFVGNDSGMMHLAAAAGTPTLGLFGPTDDRLYRPWGPNAHMLRGPRAYEDYGIGRRGFDMAVCQMLDLDLDMVVAAACRLADTSPVQIEASAA